MFDNSLNRIGVTFALGSAAVLGTAVAISRYAYEGGANGLTLAGSRSLVMVVWIFVYCILTKRSLLLCRRDWLHCAGLGLLVATMFYGNVGSVEFISIGLAALLYFTYPSMIVLINLLVLREKVSSREIFSILGGLVGLTLMLKGSVETADIRGIALVMAGAVAAAVHAVWLPRSVAHLDPFVLTFHMAVISAAMLIVAAICFGPLQWPSTLEGWGGFTGVVVLQASGVPMYFAALALIGAVKCGVFINFQPVVSLIVAYLVFGEMLSIEQLVGACFVLVGISLVHTGKEKRID